jgi:hypothetical protein
MMQILFCAYKFLINFKIKFKEIWKYEFVIMYVQYMQFIISCKSNDSLQKIKYLMKHN